jgi:hypothetical protein
MIFHPKTKGDLMKTMLGLFISLVFSLGGVSMAQGKNIFAMKEGAQMGSASATMVSGLVTEMEGDWCIVQDSEGTEWKIQVDNYTDTIGNVLPGVVIAAIVDPDGHAKQVKVLQDS